MELAGGKVIMTLEGGYDLPSICDASHECVRALLGDDLTPIRPEELDRRPCQNAIETLRKSIAIQVISLLLLLFLLLLLLLMVVQRAAQSKAPQRRSQ